MDYLFVYLIISVIIRLTKTR